MLLGKLIKSRLLLFVKLSVDCVLQDGLFFSDVVAMLLLLESVPPIKTFFQSTVKLLFLLALLGLE